MSQVKKGRNKEYDRLSQINLALLFGEESALPFYCRKLPGNITDVKTVRQLMTEFNVMGYKKVNVVLGRGFYSQDNININIYTLQMLCGSQHNICNEEGKIIGLPLNRRIGDDIIAGVFIICGLDDRTSSFASLTSEQAKRYMGMFSTVELYVGSARPEITHYKAHKVNH